MVRPRFDAEIASRIDSLTRAWGLMPNDAKVALMRDAPDLYVAISRVQVWWAVRNDRHPTWRWRIK